MSLGWIQKGMVTENWDQQEIKQKNMGTYRLDGSLETPHTTFAGLHSPSLAFD